MRYWNPSEGKWQGSPFGIKEHTVYDGPYAATVVVVPQDKKRNKADDDTDTVTVFLKTGVRIEDQRDRKTHKEGVMQPHQLPGYMYFAKTAKDKPIMVSETGTWDWHTHACGVYCYGGVPELYKPTTKFKGVPLDEHPLRKTLESLVKRAEQSYAAWLDSRRAA